MRVPSPLLVGVFLSAAACGSVDGAGQDSYSLMPSAPVLQDPGLPDSTTHRLEFVQFVGEGVLTDSRGLVAVSRDGIAAVYSPGDCTLSTFELGSGRLRWQAGRCGSGPEEFRAVSALTWLGPELIAFDGPSRTITRLNEEGGFLQRARIDEVFGDELAGLARLSSLDSRRIATSILRGREPTPPEFLLAIVDLNSGRVLHRFLWDVEAVRREPRTISLGVFSCAPGMPAPAPSLVVAGTWRFEGLAFDSVGGLLWKSAAAWAPASEPVEAQGALAPAAYARAPLCGEQGVLLRMSRTPTSAPVGTPLDGGRVQVRAYDGSVLLDVEAGPDAEILFQGGGAGGGYYVFNDQESAAPRLQLFRLVHAPGRASSAIRLHTGATLASE